MNSTGKALRRSGRPGGLAFPRLPTRWRADATRILTPHPRSNLSIAPCNGLVNHSDLGPADRWLRGLPLTWCQVLAPCQMPVFSSLLFTSQDAEMQQEAAQCSFCSVYKALSPATPRQRPGERERLKALHILKKLRSRERRDQSRWREVGLRAGHLTRANRLCFPRENVPLDGEGL